MAILTLTEIRQHLWQVKAGDPEDSKLQDAVDRANSIVERAALPVVFADYPGAATQQVVFSDGTAYLELPPYQTGSITQVRYGATDGQIVAATDYTIQGQMLRLVNYYGYTGFYPYYPHFTSGWGRGPYYITAKWGYGPAPADIIQITLELAINIFQATESGGIRQYESVEGDTIVLQTTGLSARQQAILDTLKAQYTPGVTV